MPTHSFMLSDLAGSLLAVCLFPLFVLVPGYAIAWITDLFDFRRRTGTFQLALSVPLSIAICPGVTFLAGRFGGMAAVWAFYTASWVYALAIVVRRRISLPPKSRVVAVILAAWTVIAVLSLIDLQIGHRAWFPAAAFDYSVRTQFIHSIGATGIPPGNPFFLPGHPAPLRYHYFWLLLCALVDLAGGSAVTARHAWIAGTVWCGFGLMAVVALYLRLFSYRGPATLRRRAIIGVLLLGVSGLDILPTAGLWALQAAGMHGVLPSMEWWNEQVDGFVYTAIWESHYLAGLIACLVAFLILWNLPQSQTARARYILIAGIALASAGGASIYIAFVFAIFLIVWTAATAAKRWWRETFALLAAGVLGLVLFLPYAQSLRGPSGGGPPLQLWIRPFFPVDSLFKGQALSGWSLPVANLLSLPLNYFLELGFFFAAAVLWWKKHRASGEPLTRAETATALMVATTVVICSLLRSSVIGNNDLGWRGFLFAQFGLLLWAVDIVNAWGTESGRDQRGFLTVLLVLGATGSVYELAINRFYPLLADSGTVAALSWIAPDRHAGERIYAQREAGEWIAHSTAADAVVQYNPHVGAQDTANYLYSTRQMVAADNACLATFGGDPTLCPAILATLDQIYPLAGQTALSTLDTVCHALPIDLIGATKTDPAWNDRRSWVWTQQPAFANAFVRLFPCDQSPTHVSVTK